MRVRNITLLLIAGVVAGVVTTIHVFRTPLKGPSVSVVHLRRSVANRVTATSEPSSFPMENVLDDRNEMWDVEFEIINPDGSGVLLSHDRVDVHFLDPTGKWTIAVPSNSSQALYQSLEQASIVSESTSRLGMKRIQVLVPGATQCCRLAVRYRPLTMQERCREVRLGWGSGLVFQKVQNGYPTGSLQLNAGGIGDPR